MNLSNVSKIRFNGFDISMVKINGAIVYSKGEVNPNIIVRYTANSSGVLPAFNSTYKDYTVSEIYNSDGTWDVEIIRSGDTKPTLIRFESLTSLLSLHRCDTSSVSNMSNMFKGCVGLTLLDLSSFDTSNVTSMSNTFNGCSKLTSLDLSSFDTSKVTSMSTMFGICAGLTSLNLSSFNTSNVINMNNMFNGCSKLTSLDLSSFDTSKVTGMISMFFNCSKLTSLDLSSFDTSKVTSMSNMFGGCTGLTSLKSMKNISTDLTIPGSLDEASVLDVIDNLATVTTTKTLQISAAQLHWVSSDKIMEANNKGWSISA